MRTLHDITCERCGCTTSAQGVDYRDVVVSHVCPDGARESGSFTVKDRVVPGPGERLADKETPR